MKKIITILSILLISCIQNSLYATTRTSAQSGLFSFGSTWIGGVAPIDGDNIVISTGHTVTLDVSPKVMSITIASGAILDNNTFNLSIEQDAPGGNPIYTNNGTHNGTGNLLAYEGGQTSISGNGTTNCNIIVRSFGLDLLSTCDLTINGNVQHAVPGNAGMIGKYLIDCPQLGAALTINGNIVTDSQFGSVGIRTVSDGVSSVSTIFVNGNVSMLGSTESGSGATIANSGTFKISGDLTIGPWSSFCQNDGSMIIGGDLLGSGLGDSYFWQGLNANIKFGGYVFPDPFGGLFFGVTEPINSFSTEPNTIEYNGVSAQTIKVPDDAAYSNLIINNTLGATMNLPIAVNGDLTVKPVAKLTDASGSLTVTGTFTLQSDATGTGSFITDAATSGTIQRYIAGHNNNSNEGWHLLSSPVASQAISAFHTPGTGDFFKWDEATNTWINRTATGGGVNGLFETNFAVSTGYLVANDLTDTKLFTGSLNVADVIVTGLTYTGANSYAGWHLLGNPFSSALRWNDGNWALDNIDANCQIWNEATASYTVIPANGFIPATNGFMVHASANNALLTIPAAARTHNSTIWYKNTQTSDRIVLTALDTEGGTAQSSIVQFNNNATEAYDSEYDSYFLAGLAPVFYSQSQQENYALNTLPELTGGLTIPMGFVKNGSTQFTIELTENISGQEVFLTDLKTNQTQKLNDADYTFSAEEGDDANRFLLHFGTLGIDKPAADQSIAAWVYNHQLYLLNPEPGDAMVYDMQGRLLRNYRIESSDLQSHPMNLPSGVYIVRLQGKSSMKSVKVNVQ